MELLKHISETKRGKKAQRTVLPGNELVLLTSSRVKARCHSSWSDNLSRTNRKNPSQEQGLEHSRIAGIKTSSSGEETQNKELGAKKEKETASCHILKPSSPPLKSQLLYWVMLSFYTGLMQYLAHIKLTIAF